MPILKRYALFLLLLLSFAQCKKEDDLQQNNNNNNSNTNTNNNNNNNNNSTCKDSLLPIVMMHGFLASGDTYANHVMRFTSNGYCANRLFAYDWNTLAGGNDVNRLDAFIDDVLQQTGATQVDLMGHSAGGGLGYEYLADAVRAAKVAHYVHIASGAQSAPAGPNAEIPTLNLWSDADEVVASGDIAGATNVMLTGQDHYQVATTTESFRAIYKFLNNDEEPETVGITEETVPSVSGKALTFGENTPTAGDTIRVFETNAATGERLSFGADATFVTNADGEWGPFAAVPNAYYEFEVTNPNESRKVHYYREPFTRTNPLVYLRTLPPPGGLAGILLGSLPEDDNQTGLIIFSSNQAVLETRDQLSVNGFDLATSDFAPASETAIAFFLYDGNNNSQSDGTAIATFNLLPFLVGIDQYYPTNPAATIALQFNGRTMNVRNWKSGTEGIVVPVFD